MKPVAPVMNTVNLDMLERVNGVVAELLLLLCYCVQTLCKVAAHVISICLLGVRQTFA